MSKLNRQVISAMEELKWSLEDHDTPYKALPWYRAIRKSLWAVWDWMNIPQRVYLVTLPIRNIIAYWPWLMRNQEWDHNWIAQVLEIKFRRMADCVEKYGHHTDQDKMVKELRVAAELCRRMQNENLYLGDKLPKGSNNPHWGNYSKIDCNPYTGKRDKGWAQQSSYREKAYVDMLTNLMRRKLRSWWD